MKELVMIVRPEKLEVVKGIIDKMSLGGMTVGTVMVCGAQTRVTLAHVVLL